jgi:DNA-binding CsgD family transcriptional regulator
MKWANLLFYGLALGLLLTAMQFFQYRLILLRHSTEWYVGLVALLFTVLGIWAGMKLTRKPPASATVVEQQVSPRPKEEILEQSGITPRELEVLDLMARGLSNQEIADRLYVSLNTVKTHASNVFSKLDVQRRTQAIQKAKLLGLIEA